MEPDAMPSKESVDRLERAKGRAKELLSSVDGVQGVGIGDGRLRIYLRDADVANALPDEVDGVALEPVVVGDVTTY